MNKKNKCKNCRLFSPQQPRSKLIRFYNYLTNFFFPAEKSGRCLATVIHNGDYYEIITRENDPCHWESLGIEVKEITAWSDGKNGYIQSPID